MPVKKRSLSVLKSARQSERRRKVNRARRLALKKTLKAARNVKTKAEAQELLPKAQAIVDKAARKGIIHRNKAARLKSRFARTLTRLA